SPQLTPQPRSSELPVAHDRLGRYHQHRCGFFHAETTEKSQLDDAASSLVQLCESAQRLVECHQIFRFLRRVERVGERPFDRTAASLLIPAGFREAEKGYA